MPMEKLKTSEANNKQLRRICSDKNNHILCQTMDKG